MVKIIMNGCNGHMGRVIAGLVEQDPEMEMAAGIDLEDKGFYACPVFTDIGKGCRRGAGILQEQKAAPGPVYHRAVRGAAEKSGRDCQGDSSSAFCQYVSGDQYAAEADPGGGQGTGNSWV